MDRRRLVRHHGASRRHPVLTVRRAFSISTSFVARLVLASLLAVALGALGCGGVAGAEPAGTRGAGVGGANGVDQGDFQMPFACGQVWGASTHADHPAVDWNGVGAAAGANDAGLAVLAGLGGTVVATGEQSGYGTRVIVDHGDGWSSLFGHLSAISVTVGQRVSASTQVGNVGNTGTSGGPHLHWEQRYLGQRLPVLWAGGAPIETTYGSPGPTYTSANCPPRTFGVSLVPRPAAAG